MTRRALSAVAVSGLLATTGGCGLGGLHGPDDLPPIDAEVPPADDCSERLLEDGPFVIARCPDRVSVRVAATAPGGASTVLDGLTPAVVRAEGRISGADWPVALWTTREQVSIGYSGHVSGLDAALDLRIDGDCLQGTTTLSFGDGLADRFDAFALAGPHAAAEGLGRWSVTAAAIDPTAEGGVRRGIRIFASADRALAVAAVDPSGPLETAVEGLGVRASRLGPLPLGPAPGPTATWVICVADRPWDAAVRVEQQITRGLPVHESPPRLSLMHVFDPNRLDALDDVLRRLDTTEGFGHLWLSEDWAADRTWWRPSQTLADVPSRAAPASVGLVWPLLTLPPDSPLLLAEPGWIDPDCTIGCPRLDPRIPAVREHLARLHLELRDAGFEIRLAGLDHLEPADARGLLAALIVGDGPAPTLVPPDARDFPPIELGLSPAIPLASAAPADIARQLALFGRLDAHSRIEGNVAPPTGDDPAALRTTLALALVGGHGPLPALDGADLPAMIAPLVAYWRERPTAAMARPLPGRWFDADDPPPAPPDWRAPGALVLFNWSDSPRRVATPAELAPDLVGAPRLFQPDQPALGESEAVDIPPRDVVVWATVDGGSAGE